MSEQIEPHILRRYDVIKKLGSGAYGHVWKVQDRKTRDILALKKIFDAFQHSTDAQRTFRQVMFLRQFNHPNIIRLKGLHRAQNDKDIYLLFQYMQADLHGVIRENILNPMHKKCIIFQIAKAVRYLHSSQLIHRDLKPSNILLNSDCRIKLCDFGLIRSIDTPKDQQPVLTQYVATRWYRAPQLLLGSTSYTKGVDQWSLGCMIGQMVRGKALFPGNSTLNQLQRILSLTGWPNKQQIQSMGSSVAQSILATVPKVRKKSVQQWFPKAPADLIWLITGLLQFNPQKRLNIQQVLEHPYLAQIYSKSKDDDDTCDKKISLYIGDFDRLPVGAYRGLLYQMIKNEDAKDKQLNKSQKLRDKKSSSDKQTTQIVLNDRSSKNSSSIDKKQRYTLKWSLPKKSREKRYQSTKLKADYHAHSISKDKTQVYSLSKSKKPKRHSLIDNISQQRRGQMMQTLDDKQRGSKKLNQIIIKVPRCAPVNATFIQYSQYLKHKKPKKSK